MVVLALLAGWVLGASLNARPVADPVEAVEEADVELDVPAEELATEPAASERVTVVMVQAPLRGVAIPAQLTVIEDGVPTPIVTDRRIAGATQSVIGQADQRLLVVGDSVVFMAVDAVMVFDPATRSEPVEIATAIYLMDGSAPGRVWAVTSGSRSVLDIDVRERSVRAEYDLTGVGLPVGSFAGGLVVVPFNDSLGEFALWSPRRGIERLWDLSDRSTFLDASDNTIVVHTSQGVASYDVVAGSLNQTEVQLEPRARHRSFVSPDGARLAVLERGTIVQLPTVSVIDLQSGEMVDQFETAYEWQLQWASDHEILFVIGTADDVEVMIRDTKTSTSSVVTSLAGPQYWVTTLPS
jgi:hypothetical protein